MCQQWLLSSTPFSYPKMTDSLLLPGTRFEFRGSSAGMRDCAGSRRHALALSWVPSPVLCPLPHGPDARHPEGRTSPSSRLFPRCRRMGVSKNTCTCSKSFEHVTEERKREGLVIQWEACRGRRGRGTALSCRC